MYAMSISFVVNFCNHQTLAWNRVVKGFTRVISIVPLFMIRVGPLLCINILLHLHSITPTFECFCRFGDSVKRHWNAPDKASLRY